MNSTGQVSLKPPAKVTHSLTPFTTKSSVSRFTHTWGLFVPSIFLFTVFAEATNAQQAGTSQVTLENVSDYNAEILMKDPNSGQYRDAGQWPPGQKATFPVYIGSEWRYVFQTPNGKVIEDYIVKNQPAQTWTLTGKNSKRPTPPRPPGRDVAQSTTISGQNLTSVDVYDGTTKTGIIRQKTAGQWEWVEAGQSHTWREVRRTDTSVFLGDQQSYIELNIPQGGIFGSDSGFRTGDRYYLLKNPVAEKKTSPAPGQVAKVTLNNVGNQPLTVIEQNGNAVKNLGTLAAGREKTYDTVMGRVIVVKAGDGSELTRINVNSPYQSRPLAYNSAPMPTIPMPTATKSVTPKLAKWYRIQHVQTGAVLDVPRSSEDDGAQIGVYANFDQPNQQFRFQQGSKGYYFLVNRNSGKGVAVENVSAQAGAKVVQYSNGPGGNDQFRIQSAAGQNVYLIFKHSGKPLAISNNLAVQGATLDRSAEFQLTAVADYKGGSTPPPRPMPGDSSEKSLLGDSWYQTADQSSSTRIRILSKDQIGERDQIKRTQASLKGYYFPKMHPYKLRYTGTQDTLMNLFERDDEYTGNSDFYWPSIFFMERDGSGSARKSGKLFFSEAGRQKAWEASASVEAGGFGVSVGLKAEGGEYEESSEGSESMSVVATSYQASYWLWLNKRKVRLTEDFVEEVMSMSDPDDFMLRYGSHYPLAVLYGGRAMYDETVKSENFSKSISNHWNVGASASGGAFGIDAAAAASYGETKGGNEAGGRTLSSVEITNIGGDTAEWPVTVTPENAYPIKVVLKPIYELIRPELFEGHAPDRVLEKRRRLEETFLKLISDNKRPEGEITEAFWPTKAGLINSKDWTSGTPIMFSWFFENVTNVESLNRDDVMISKHPTVANAYIARLTVIPHIKGTWFRGEWSGYYDYDLLPHKYQKGNLKGQDIPNTAKKCRLRVTFENGRQSTLDYYPFGTAPREVSPYIASTHPIAEVGGYPKYAPTRSALVNGIATDKGKFTEFFQEAPLTKTEEGQIQLPSPPWLRRR